MVKKIRLFFAHGLVQGGMRVMMVNAVGMGLAYVTHVLFAIWLGLEQYGYYVYALAWMSVLTIAVQFGMNTSTVRITSELRARGDYGSILGLSTFSTQIVVAVGVGVMVLGGVTIMLLSEFLARELVWTLAVMLVLVVAVSLLYQRMALLQGFERVVQAQVFLEIMRPLALIALVGVSALFITVDAHWAMAANLFATVVALVAASVLTAKVLDTAGQGNIVKTVDRHAWLAMSLPYLVIGALTVVMNQSDVLMLGTMMGGVAAGLYSPAIKLAQLVLFPMMAMRSRAAPLLAKLYAQGDMDELQRQMNASTITSVLTGLFLGIALIWQGEALLSLFGPDFVAAAPTLVVLVLGMAVFTITGGVEVFLIFGPFERMTVLIYSLVVALNITLNLILIPSLGALGAAYATAVTVIARGLISTFVVWQRTGILPWAPVNVYPQEGKGAL